MEQHPVPQNISSYEFRLVGDMTLKQFFMLSGGVVMGIIFFRLPIPGIFKYPLTALSILVGVLSAFVPFQGRPFYLWVVAFFRAIYAPTEYVWAPTPPATPEIISAPLTPTVIPHSASQGQVVTGFFSFFTSLFAPKKVPPVTTTNPVVAVPPLSSPSPSPISTPPPSSSPPSPAFTATPSHIPTPTPPPEIIGTPQPKITTFATITKVPSVPQPSSPTPAKADSSRPRPAPLPSAPPPPPPVRPSGPFPGLPQVRPPTVTPPPATAATSATPIASPTVANILAGQVADSLNLAISGATVEIIDSHTGIPARALRTNRLGQFQIAIPLPSGSYILNAEKPGFTFEPVSVQVANAIIPPIIIKAQ